MNDSGEEFTGRVAEYERYRERYDPELVQSLLRDWCGLQPEWVVADVGAGTGMLSDVFLANGNHVTAVEPNAEMRMACARLHEGVDGLTIVNGSAEATSLPDASVDLVSVGRALHWFDLERALREFRRVLVPGGWVVVVAVGRSKDGREENRAYEELLDSLTPNREATMAAHAVYERLHEVFPAGELRHAMVAGEVRLGWEELLGMSLSYSYAPLPGTAESKEFEDALRGYFARYEKDGAVTISTRCWINAGALG